MMFKTRFFWNICWWLQKKKIHTSQHRKPLQFDENPKAFKNTFLAKLNYSWLSLVQHPGWIVHHYMMWWNKKQLTVLMGFPFVTWQVQYFWPFKLEIYFLRIFNLLLHGTFVPLMWENRRTMFHAGMMCWLSFI